MQCSFFQFFHKRIFSVHITFNIPRELIRQVLLELSVLLDCLGMGSEVVSYRHMALNILLVIRLKDMNLMGAIVYIP